MIIPKIKDILITENLAQPLQQRANQISRRLLCQITYNGNLHAGANWLEPFYSHWWLETTDSTNDIFSHVSTAYNKNILKGLPLKLAIDKRVAISSDFAMQDNLLPVMPGVNCLKLTIRIR